MLIKQSVTRAAFVAGNKSNTTCNAYSLQLQQPTGPMLPYKEMHFELVKKQTSWGLGQPPIGIDLVHLAYAQHVDRTSHLHCLHDQCTHPSRIQEINPCVL